MGRSYYAYICVLILSSCTSWETQKISAEDVLQQEWNTIAINEVDVYPSFDLCATLTEKKALKECFETAVHEAFLSEMGKHQIVVHQAIDDTVWVDFIINEKGAFCLDSLHVSENTRNVVPDLPLWIQDAAASLPKGYPATKRGIPVKARFKIPVVIKVD